MHVKQTNQAAAASDSRLREQIPQETAPATSPPTSHDAAPQLHVDPRFSVLPKRASRPSSPAARSDIESAEADIPSDAAQHQDTTLQTRSPTAHAPSSLFRKAASGLTEGALQLSGTLRNAASNLWSLTDLRTMLQIHADDPAFLRMVRHTDPEQSAPRSLAACREQITRLRTVIEAAPDLEARFRKQLLGDIKAVEDALQPLEQGTPATGRALKSLVNLVNLWPLVVPSPLLANQAKTFAYSIAAATRGVMTLSASALRPTADGLPFPMMGGQLGRDANEMHFYAILLNGLFLTTELPKKFGNPSMRHQAEAVENNLGFAAAASTACAAIVITPFLWNSINALGNRLQSRVSHLGADIAQRAGFHTQAERLRTRLTPGQISAQLRNELNGLCAALQNGHDAFQQARRRFTDPSEGHELTRTLNAQCTHLLEMLDQCSKRLNTALQVDQDQPSAIPRQVANHDVYAKLPMAMLGIGVTALTVYLIQPDRIGTVDLLADSAVVTTVMLQSVFNKHATRQDAMERFKAMCSGSMVMALALGVEKLSKSFADQSLIEASSSSPYYAGAVMTLMSMTMPGPMARGAELAMNWGGGQLGRIYTGPDGTPLATSVPSSAEELQERSRTTLAYVTSLAPEQLDQYLQTAGESTLHAIREAGETAQAGPGSSVTITEIEEETEHAVERASPGTSDGTDAGSSSDDAITQAPSPLR
ncbi:XopX family type III secretion system effector [Xanthomonas vesicatoria]|uniref:XopX family type III secretion system effector n=1 Tax=Xanthomonas vesicatoria TaxID=56460 RepID=UPI0009C033B6|nr:XopX family type III secretion system effector [Xanthomonas vesicatoria]MCC8559237.1 type III secretion system effector protein [Xanthomonas vesicatoria]MCC8600974.1 type III secretion system effector protein [Xanthomonas vesicatoria]MCC8608060.1 type III secretion system effector protein [Xanthomonas vesicatoria]MCC8674726.1 type III secretion system effector protein [Xanthomonas vesicatoria]MCC8677266.1 type III secretion system effector protein [Xanthomonas vesicatoria]